MVMDANNNSLLWQFPATAMYEYDTFWTIGILSSDGPRLFAILAFKPISRRGGNLQYPSGQIGLLYVLVGSENATAGDGPTYTNRNITTCDSFTISGALQIFRDGRLIMQICKVSIGQFLSILVADFGNFDEEAIMTLGILVIHPSWLRL